MKPFKPIDILELLKQQEDNSGIPPMLRRLPEETPIEPVVKPEISSIVKKKVIESKKPKSSAKPVIAQIEETEEIIPQEPQFMNKAPAEIVKQKIMEARAPKTNDVEEQELKAQKRLQEKEKEKRSIGIAEAIGGFGARLQGKDTGSYFKDRKDAIDKRYQDEDTLNNTKDERDPASSLSQSYHELAAKYGADREKIKNMSAIQLKPLIENYEKKYKIDRDEENKVQARDDKFALAKIMQSGSNIRQDKNLDWRQEQDEKNRKTLSDKQVSELDTMDNLLNRLDSIKRNKKDIDTGTIANARNTVAQFFGVDDSEVSGLKAMINDNLGDYVRSLSGTAASDGERRFLKENIPSLSQNDETFMEKLTNFEEKVREMREIKLNNLQRKGKDVENFREPSIPASKSNSQPPLERKGKDGVIYLFDPITKQNLGPK